MATSPPRPATRTNEPCARRAHAPTLPLLPPCVAAPVSSPPPLPLPPPLPPPLPLPCATTAAACASAIASSSLLRPRCERGATSVNRRRAVCPPRRAPKLCMDAVCRICLLSADRGASGAPALGGRDDLTVRDICFSRETARPAVPRDRASRRADTSSCSNVSSAGTRGQGGGASEEAIGRSEPTPPPHPSSPTHFEASDFGGL